MKRNKFLTLATTLVAPTTLLAPMLVATSCNKNTKQSPTLLDNLQELTVSEFKKMCLIPHSSDKILWKAPEREGNVWTMSCYLRQRAASILGVPENYIYQDNFGNLVFDIPSTDAEYNDYPVIALQAHMDMVFSFDEKQYPAGQEPDPLTTSIDLVDEVKDGKRVLHSRDYKTTIGADDGMGVATILALMQTPEFKHGKLRVILTNCEENAMQGAQMMIEGAQDPVSGEPHADATCSNVLYDFDPIHPDESKLVDIKNVINLDGGIDGSIIVACSGGVGSHYKNTFKPATLVEGGNIKKFKLTLGGFTGGHSGGAPHANHGNPIKIAMEILEALEDKDLQIASISTPGTKVYNKVGSECIVEFATTKTEDEIKATFDAIIEKHKQGATEGEDKEQISIYFNDLNKDKWTVEEETGESAFTKVIGTKDTQDVLALHKGLQYGYRTNWEAKAKKSSSNVGPTTLALSSDGESFDFKTSSYSRSDDEDTVNDYLTSNIGVIKTLGWDIKKNYECDAKFPGWSPTSDTPTKEKLYQLTAKGFQAAGFEEENIKPAYIHGGVECSWWMKAMDYEGNCTCIGVNVVDEHEPTESVDVASIKQNFTVLGYMLQHANELE